MASGFETYALRKAEASVLKVPRRFISWEAFMEKEYRYHYLLLGTTRNAFDRCHNVLLCDHSQAPYPAQAIVRPYLKILTELQGPPVRRPLSPDEDLFHRAPPTYFPGQSHGELSVVDLTAAYWQLYAPLTLDITYDGSALPRQGRVRFLGADELAKDKHLRNALVGTIRAEYRTEVDHGKVRKIPMTKRWQRPALWALIQDLLELVAWDMRLCFGAVHIHTDGYILPSRELGRAALDFLADEWGLVGTIKAEGLGRVQALGSWRIGEEMVGQPEADVGAPVDSMTHAMAEPELKRWWQEAKTYREQVGHINLRNGVDSPW